MAALGGPGRAGGQGHCGAAAIAYQDGQRVGSLSIKLPSCDTATEAEAHGAALAVELARRHGEHGSAAILNDCAAMVAFCAGKGRLRSTRAVDVLRTALLRTALGDAAAAAIRAQWYCINRSDNTTADAIAKAARHAGRPTPASKGLKVRPAKA